MPLPGIRKTRYTVYDCRRGTEAHIYEEAVGDDEKDSLHYIANMETGTVVGYKYFDFAGPVRLSLRLRGAGRVRVSARLDSPEAEAAASNARELHGGWEQLALDTTAIRGVHALYLSFEAEAPLQFESLDFRAE